MNGWKVRRRGLATATIMALLSAADTGAAELDPAAVGFKLPDQFNWKGNATAGDANTVLYDDPSPCSPSTDTVRPHGSVRVKPSFLPLNDRMYLLISPNPKSCVSSSNVCPFSHVPFAAVM